MSKKKTQLDRAIDLLEGDLLELRRQHDAQRTALESTISRLRQQRAAAPARKRRTVAAPAEPRA